MKSALSIALVLLSATFCKGQQRNSPQQIVDANFPPSLAGSAAQRNLPDLQHSSCFAVYDQLPNGSPRTIMAGYSNGDSGAIRVIQADTSGNYNVLFEPANLGLFGFNCKVKLVDLNGDGTNEVIISFQSFKGDTVSWPLQWDGSQLADLAPDVTIGKKTEPGSFFNMALTDIYHDGTLQVVDGGEYPPPMDGSAPTAPRTLYRLQGGKFVAVEPLFFSGAYTRSKGKPQTVSSWFQLVQGASGPYTLHLTNGDKNGANRVSSAHVVLNGAEVVSPQQLSQQVESLDVPLNLVPNNNIQVTLDGAPGGDIAVVVTGTVSSQ